MAKFTHAFTLFVKKRKKPNYNYTGILRTHRFYISYHDVFNDQSPEKAVSENNSKIVFPVRFTEAILDFAKELGGEVVKVQKVTPPRCKYSYEKPIVALPSEVAFRRHLVFTLTISTYRKPTRINAVRNLVLNNLNAIFLNILSQMALERYSELRGSENPAWVWYVLRVGRAVKTLYKLD